MKKKILITFGLLGIVLWVLFKFISLPLPKNHGVVEYQLFLSSGKKSPLIVAFGGSEGGMVYAGKEPQDFRDSILALGYHFLAVGYFGTQNTPRELDRISLDAIHDTIKSVTQHPLVDGDRIAVFGGSRGGELVLNLASNYNDLDAVIAIVPSSVSLPSRFGWGETSAWTFERDEVSYLSATNEALERIHHGDFYHGFSMMLENQQDGIDSEIPVEKINAPVLLISASQDEVWPSTMMCHKMINRLKRHNFQHFYEHIELAGGHSEVTKNYGLIFDFLKQHFPI